MKYLSVCSGVEAASQACETIEDIMREMRGDREFYGAEFRTIADRIEAAHEREKAAIIASEMMKDRLVGEMRDALREIMDRLYYKPECGRGGSYVIRKKDFKCEWQRLADGEEVAK